MKTVPILETTQSAHAWAMCRPRGVGIREFAEQACNHSAVRQGREYEQFRGFQLTASREIRFTRIPPSALDLSNLFL